MVEWASLLRKCAHHAHRGFESLPLRSECASEEEENGAFAPFVWDSKAAAMSEFILRQQNKAKTARQGREIFTSVKILLTESGGWLPCGFEECKISKELTYSRIRLLATI